MPSKLPVPFFRPSFLSSPHPTSSPQPPPLSLSLSPSLHLCHYCPLSNLITQALYSPFSSSSCSSFFCLSVSPLTLVPPSPLLTAVARHQGQISPSLPPSFFTLPPLTLYFLFSVATLKFLSLPRLARFIFVISSSCFCYECNVEIKK